MSWIQRDGPGLSLMNEVLSIVPWAAPWGLGEKEEAGTKLGGKSQEDRLQVTEAGPWGAPG
jgi:hypothetical protein